ncbi:uncharacterized protein LOC144552544 [Carex rostrata]
MGILSLETQNEALLTKWLWKLDRDSNGLWAQTMSILYGITNTQQLLPNINYSEFARSICHLLPFYRVATIPDEFFPIIHWKFTTHGNFTTSSAYAVLHDRGIRCPLSTIIWKLKVSHKVRIFIWLLLRGRLLTQRRLWSRGCQVPSGCHLCMNADLESSKHLFFQCPYAMGFWRMLLFRFNITFPPTNPTRVQDLWYMIRKGLDKPAIRIWDTVWVSGCWAL